MNTARIGIILAILLALTAPAFGQHSGLWEDLRHLPPCRAEHYNSLSWAMLAQETDSRVKSPMDMLLNSHALIQEAYDTQTKISEKRWLPIRAEAHEAFIEAIDNLFLAAQYAPCREIIAYQIAYYDMHIRQLLQLYLNTNIDHAEEVATFKSVQSQFDDSVKRLQRQQ